MILRHKDALLRIAGLGFCKNWFAVSGFSLSTPLAQAIDLYSLASFAFFLFIAAVFHRRTSCLIVAQHRVFLFVGAIGGIATVFPLTAIDYPFLSLLCSLGAGACLGAVLLGWGILFCRLDLQTLLRDVLLATLAMLLFHLVYVLLPADLNCIYRGTSILVSGVFLVLAYGAKPHADISFKPLSGISQVKGRFLYCIRYFVAINLLALAINWMYNFYRFNNLGFFDLQAMSAILVQVIYIAILIVFFLIKRVRAEHIYFITAATTALSFLLLPIFGFDSPLPLLMLFVGFLSLDMLILVLSARISALFSVSPVVAIGVSQGSFLGLQIVIARSLVAGYFPFEVLDATALSLMTLVGVVLVGLACFCIFNRGIIYKLLPEEALLTEARNVADTTSVTSHGKDSWDGFCKHHRLTVRESEVIALFAQGRSYARIQELLYISRGTVNYHVNNAYRKIGCNSRQDLLDALDSFRSAH